MNKKYTFSDLENELHSLKWVKDYANDYEYTVRNRQSKPIFIKTSSAIIKYGIVRYGKRSLLFDDGGRYWKKGSKIFRCPYSGFKDAMEMPDF